MARSVITRFVPALLGAGLFSLAAIGCVSKDDYHAINADRDNLAEQLAAAQREAEGNRKLAEGYRTQLASMGDGARAESGLLASLQQENANLKAERDQLMSKYEGMLGQIGTGPALPPPLTDELTEFARSNPEVVSFDAKSGIVKFKSDVTFASGDAEVTAEARSVIGRFAQILNGPVASNYELRVTGHTDSVRVTSQLTRSKGHKDNWYLSSHRAISVAEALRSAGVAETRMGVTGFADQRPVASNDTPAGKQQNRRVEVLILPTTVSTPQPTTPAAQTPAAEGDATTAALPDSLSK